MKLIRALALASLFTLCVSMPLRLGAQNAALMPMPKLQFFDQNGVPLAGGLIYTYAAGTTTPLATYTDSTGSVPNTNPVVLDSGGFGSIWLGSSNYKIVAETSAGVQVWSVDNVSNAGSLLGINVNGSAMVKYTPAATGGQTRSLQAIQYDEIDAGNYDTITHAVADACTNSPAKLVRIPATVAASQTYTNSCNAPILDMRLGTEASPLTGRTFQNPNISLFAWDASPATSDPLAHGDQRLAPALKIMTTGSGAESIVPIYTESNYYAGFSGAAYGGMTVLQTFPGSTPQGIAHNWVWADQSYMPITGCSVSSGVATCTINLTVAQNAETKTITNPYASGNFLHISGCTDSSMDTGRFGVTLTAAGTNSVTFSTGHANGSGLCTSGGTLSGAPQSWGFELDQFENARDPTSVTPLVAQNVPPVWGITETSLGTYPISAGFFTSGAKYYDGYLCQDAIDACFVAGYPVSGGSALGMTHGFWARPSAVATNGANYGSVSLSLTDSVYDATAGYLENTLKLRYAPVSSSADATGILQLISPNANSLMGYTDAGQWQAANTTAAAPSYSFAGDPTSGLYRDSGGQMHLAVAGANVVDVTGSAVNTNQVLNVKNGLQVNGVSGYTGTITCSAGQHINSLTINNGIITAAPTCN